MVHRTGDESGDLPSLALVRATVERAKHLGVVELPIGRQRRDRAVDIVQRLLDDWDIGLAL